MKRKICIVTGSRADYGLLYWLMKEIQRDFDLKLQIIVTGMHLSPEFGLTYKVIENDGFHIDEKVEMLLSSDTSVGIAKSIGLATIGFADALQRLSPDILVLLGDRYEILAAAQAAMVACIPIAHLHGGESTEGLIDEAIRHSVTKMSHLHFVSADTHRKRVIQLGENPDTVFNFGAPGLDNINRLKLLDKKTLQKNISFLFGDINFLVTYHPVTLNQTDPEKLIRNLLEALDYFPGAKIIFTKQNSDTSGRLIGRILDDYVRANPLRSIIFTSMGQLRYLSTMKIVNVVIGNSSSGLIEAPVLKKATVNIGDRQKGRLKAKSVIDCKEGKAEIVAAIRKALSPSFQKSLAQVDSLYGNGKSSLMIKNKIKKYSLKDIVIKNFYDLK